MTHKQEEQRQHPERTLRTLLFDREGKPLRVLSTSLGIALLAHALLGAAPAAGAEGEQASSPKLLEWSTEDVKAFYDPAADWNLPLMPEDTEETPLEEGSASGAGGSHNGGTTVVHSGFGWGDLLLYHMIFNRGSAYSASSWHANNRAYDLHTGSAYKPRSYTADAFQNKQVPNSRLGPKTVQSSGAITRRSTSASKGGIGGKSSGFGSSSSSKSSGWFGG